MDEAFAPAGAIDKAALKALSRRSDARGLAQLAGHGVALGVTGVLLSRAVGTAWLAPAMLAHAAVLVFLFAPLHETIHRTAFASRRLNDAVAWLCGLALLLPPEYFRAYHFAHHRHTQNPARDPELATAKPASLSSYLWHVSGLPFWGGRVGTLLCHGAGRVGEAFIPPRQRRTIAREARIALALYAALAAASALSDSWTAVLYWMAPAVLGQPLLRLFLLAEHSGCPMTPDMLRNSRTTRSNALMRRLAWNMPFHAEHHAYPALPFHALPAAHAHLNARIAVQAPGYVAVHREILGALGRRRPAPAGS